MYSRIWSGYAVSGHGFSKVTAKWTLKPIVCSSNNGLTSVSLWVGLDGVTDNTVEQTGSSGVCIGHKTDYYAWYEMYPRGPHPIKNHKVEPGDHFSATVTHSGGRNFHLVLQDLTRHWTYRTSQSMKAKDTSAEAVVEQSPNAPGLTEWGGKVPFTGFMVDGWAAGKFANLIQLELKGVSAPCDSISKLRGSESFTATWLNWCERQSHSWSLDAFPGPANSSTALSGISCTSAQACIAVGDGGQDGGYTLAEVWNGTSWNVQNTPAVYGNQFFSVSCVTMQACTAVGQGGYATLAENWNGTSWNIQSTPSLPYASLSGVSCTAVDACIAVGDYGQNNDHTLAEVWNGTSWSIQKTPRRSGAAMGLQGVSCVSASFCMAVGYMEYLNPTEALAEVWNGTSWRIHEPPHPQDSFLTGVSCVSARFCTAVGDGPAGALIDVWNGSSWTSQSSAAAGYLNSVTCSSAQACVAVGDGQYSPIVQGQAVHRTLVEVRQGSRWIMQNTPNKPTNGGSALYGVSCNIYNTACIAVGAYSYDEFRNTSFPLAERETN